MFIVDDHGCSGRRSAELGTRRVVAEAEDVGEAVAASSGARPDVVLLDVHLPGGGGRGDQSSGAPPTDACPRDRFLALSVSDAAEDVIARDQRGARGYVTKTITGPELVDAIRRVAEGDAVFSPRLAGSSWTRSRARSDRGRRRST